MDEASLTKAEILAQYRSALEPFERKANERMAWASSPERAARIHRDFMTETQPIRDHFAGLLALLPLDPIVITAEEAKAAGFNI